MVSVRSRVQRLLRRAGRRLTARARPVPPLPPPDRLEFRVDGDVAIVGVRLAQARRGLRELQLRSRGGELIASYPFAPPGREHIAVASIDLAELVSVQGWRGTANVYLTWRRGGDRATDRTQEPADLARKRVGGFVETSRPPRSQHTVVDGVEVRLDVTVNGNLAVRVDDDPGTGVRCTTSGFVQ